MSKEILLLNQIHLWRKSDSPEKVDDELSLMDDMLETMYSAPGIGLAAVQIGILKRIIVIDVSKEDQEEPLFLVNPKLLKSQKIQLMKRVVYHYWLFCEINDLQNVMSNILAMMEK